MNQRHKVGLNNFQNFQLLLSCVVWAETVVTVYLTLTVISSIVIDTQFWGDIVSGARDNGALLTVEYDEQLGGNCCRIDNSNAVNFTVAKHCQQRNHVSVLVCFADIASIK